MSEELTEQESVALVAKEWEEIGLATGIGDHLAAEQAIRDAYTAAGVSLPGRIEWARSVKEGLEMAARARHGLGPEDKLSGSQLRQALGEVAYSQPDAPWLARVDWVLRFAKPKKNDKPDSATVKQYTEAQAVEPLLRLAHHVCWYWPYDELAILVDRPLVLTRDDNGDLHNETGPAMAWSDGYRLYFWHGVAVPEDVIEHPDTYPPEKVFGEPNVEVRRAMVEKIGWNRLADKLGLRVIQSDKWGELMRADRTIDTEPLVLVRMVNSTPEGEFVTVAESREPRVFHTVRPDGTPMQVMPQLARHKEFQLLPGPHGETPPYFKVYVNRVPPQTRTAHEGLAWSFGMTPEEYQPSIET